MKTLRPTLAAFALAVTTIAAGCSSSPKYVDPDEVDPTTIDWGPGDLQYFADYMTSTLIESPALNYFDSPAKGADKRVIAGFGDIQNQTREHINTDMISQRIQSNLLESGKFRFVARKEAAGQSEIEDEVRFQQGSGRVDPNRAVAFGKQLGAEVVIYGTLSDIYQQTGRSIESVGTKKKDLYYQFYMAAVNVETGELLWAKTEDIRKKQTVGLFGRG